MGDMTDASLTPKVCTDTFHSSMFAMDRAKSSLSMLVGLEGSKACNIRKRG